MDVMNVFAVKLKELRESMKLKQSELGEKLGVSRGSISYYENRDRVPDVEFLAKAANFFGVSADYLLGRSRAAAPDDFMQEAVRRCGLSEEAFAHLERINAPLDIDKAEQERVIAKQRAIERDIKSFRGNSPYASNALTKGEVPYFRPSSRLSKEEFQTIIGIEQNETNKQILSVLNELFTIPTGREWETFGMRILLAIYNYCHREYKDIDWAEYAKTGEMHYTLSPEKQRLLDLHNLNEQVQGLRNTLIQNANKQRSKNNHGEAKEEHRP